MNTTTFAELNLIEPLQKAIETIGYQTPTPIQQQAIPPLLEGRDLLGIAQTGTGKTAAFALPILQHLANNRRKPESRATRVLVLTPTRELAAQIDTSFGDYGQNLRVRRSLIFGGVGQNPQVRTMSRGVDVLTATPGRLLDLINQKHIRLDQVEVFVLDEADRMLDMGFIHDVRKVVDLLPKGIQTLLFSATMPSEISQLAKKLMQNPVRVEVTPPATTVERIDQQVFFVDKADKRRLLSELLSEPGVGRALVFCRTKHGSNKVVKELDRDGIRADAIHGNKSQTAREKALAGFRAGKIPVLIATDIAARGIDVEGITHVIQFDLPNEPEVYVHRIGRTARAGADGAAYAFCAADERPLLRDIQRTIRQTVPVNTEHRFHSQTAMDASEKKTKDTAGVTQPRPSRPPRSDSRNGGEGRRRKPAQTGQRTSAKPEAPQAKRAAKPANQSDRPQAEKTAGEGGSKPPRRRRRGGSRQRRAA